MRQVSQWDRVAWRIVSESVQSKGERLKVLQFGNENDKSDLAQRQLDGYIKTKVSKMATMLLMQLMMMR